MHQSTQLSYKVTFSLVVYKQPLEELRQVVNSLLLYKAPKRIYIVDNSPTDEARKLETMDDCIVYRFSNKNVGFGSAHNWAIKQAMEVGSVYHFVVNPDIKFDTDVVTPMISWLDEHPDVAQMMPRILYPNGRMQYLPKLMPSPLKLVQRRLRRLAPKRYKGWMTRFEMRPMRDDRVYDVGHVSGCFSVARTEALRQCGLYDERFFLYFEDTDLTRRLHERYRTVYYPMVSVYHDYGNAAGKSMRNFFIFVCSMIKFFCKWGWLSDSYRRRCNREMLKQIDL